MTGFSANEAHGHAGRSRQQAIGRNCSHSSQSSHDAPQQVRRLTGGLIAARTRQSVKLLGNVVVCRRFELGFQSLNSSVASSHTARASGTSYRPATSRLCETGCLAKDKRLPSSPAHEREVERIFLVAFGEARPQSQKNTCARDEQRQSQAQCFRSRRMRPD